MANAVKLISGRLNPLKLFLVPRELTRMLVDFAASEGILSVMKEMRAFTLQSLITRLSSDLGYRFDEPVKARMISTICDFLVECEVLSPGCDGQYVFTFAGAYGNIRGKDLVLDDEERALLERYFGGQMLFFATCLAEAGGFLRGRVAPFAFSKRWESLWNGFLGNYEFQMLRDILVRLMDLRDDGSFKVLDLCYGLGHGVEGILKHTPGARVAALDFSGAYGNALTERVKRYGPIGMVELHDGAWKGFGDPLPFPDSSLDAIQFTCADPYIPEQLRESVYTDMHRVLKPGGTLGVLAWSYPDRERKLVTNEWVRRQILAHDFMESVCAGWHGFYGAKDTSAMFDRVGFKPRQGVVSLDTNLSSALWVLGKK